MATATLSSKGQLVIPSEIRQRLGFKEGDILDIDIDEETGSMRLKKARTLEEISEYFTSRIKPGIKPLTSPDELYAGREPRL
jgi:AbrB family looped-hinge helix DNA binding protein